MWLARLGAYNFEYPDLADRLGRMQKRVISAQARDYFAVLNECARRALRVHLGTDVTAGLAILKDAGLS